MPESASAYRYVQATKQTWGGVVFLRLSTGFDFAEGPDRLRHTHRILCNTWLLNRLRTWLAAEKRVLLLSAGALCVALAAESLLMDTIGFSADNWEGTITLD